MIYEETRGVLKTFLEGVIRDAVTYTEHAKRVRTPPFPVSFPLSRCSLAMRAMAGGLMSAALMLIVMRLENGDEFGCCLRA